MHDGVGIVAILRRKDFRIFLAGLLFLDLVLIALHVDQLWAEWRAADVPGFTRGFSLEEEGGPGEAWEAAKTLLCILALADLARRSGTSLYAALAFGFSVALLDNTLALHETGGAWFAPWLPGVARFVAAEPHAVGELLVFALLGLLIAAALLVGFARSPRAHWPAALVLVGLLALLGGFGVGLDLLHAALAGLRRLVDRGLGLIEDGGELLTLSFATAFAVALRRHLMRREG